MVSDLATCTLRGGTRARAMTIIFELSYVELQVPVQYLRTSTVTTSRSKNKSWRQNDCLMHHVRGQPACGL